MGREGKGREEGRETGLATCAAALFSARFLVGQSNHTACVYPCSYIDK